MVQGALAAGAGPLKTFGLHTSRQTKHLNYNDLAEYGRWQPRRTAHCLFAEHNNNDLHAQRDNLNSQLVYVYGKEGGSWGGHASTFYIPQTHLCHLP